MASEKKLRINFGDWDAVIADAYAIREDVFVEEQQIPLALEFDAIDAQCLHAVVYAGNDAVGTGRLLPDGYIGRIAVRRAARGMGVGTQVLQGLLDKARERGQRQVTLNAQIQAEPFYAHFGFVREGAPFDEAGIAHIAMTLVF
jgi:predicted GNAT family N-acyltransferase